MERLAYKQLIDWKLAKNRKPLIVYGARQVGKTYLIQQFGEKEFADMVYVNCYKNDNVRKLFEGDADVNRLLLGLSAIVQRKIEIGKTLLFLDEIQEIPPVLSSLKYFYENMPELHIIVAGSLLGVMNMKGESFPVGKVNIMHLYPMNYEEFLLANGADDLVKILKESDKTLMNALSSKYIEYLRQYYYVGGMPEAVCEFIQTKDIQAVRRIQNDILSAYEVDISKHTGDETQRVRMVWQSIPSQLARENKKFIYGAVRKGARAKDFEVAIQWLIDAGLVYKVEKTKCAKMPLKFYADMDAFKLYLIDVGLLGAISETSAAQVLIGDNIFCEHSGAFTENFVLQQLKSYQNIPIYYFSKDNSTQEIDFIIQTETKIIPIEVKAEKNIKSKSLSTFINQDHADENLKGVRFSMKGFQDQGWMENIPLFAVRTCLEN